MRTAEITRSTNETAITVAVNLDGTGKHAMASGVGFFDHMLDQLARHALIDITLSAKGDLHIDDHHTVEDCGIALGQALARALGDKRGIRRYGECALPMDDAQVRCALDLSGRPLSCGTCPSRRPRSAASTRARARVFPGAGDPWWDHAAPRPGARV